MKTLRILTLAAAAALMLAGCAKDPSSKNGDVNDNWWYTGNLGPKGVKTIVDNNLTENYDKDGRLISSKSTWGESTITYNSDGLPVKVVEKGLTEGTVTGESVTTYEYKNKGKFCPVPMGPGSIFHLFENGLLPGLSKVTFGTGDDANVMEYKFSGNTLTVSTSGTYSHPDDDGKMVEEPYEDIVWEYSGAYPLKFADDKEFLGPFTFQENGMFDTYVEGFFDWDHKGFVTTHRTRTISKEFKDKMLPEKEVDLWYNYPSEEPYDTETITYTYNEHGDVVKELVTHTAPLSENTETTYEYEYDDHGNWIKCSGSIKVVDGKVYNTWTETRTIEYY